MRLYHQRQLGCWIHVSSGLRGNIGKCQNWKTRKKCSTILEVKAKDGNTKSAKTVMSHPEHYGKTELIRIKDSNLSAANNILTIPHYMAYLLFEWQAVLPIM